MRPALTYTSARILLFVATLGLLYLTGARGLLLLALALLASGILSYVLLSRQRDAMSSKLTGRLTSTRARIQEFGSRIDEGTKAEDQD
jgi:Mn2+/Fe2+ NRAMP family transporter